MKLTWQNWLAVGGTVLLVFAGVKSCYDNGVARAAQAEMLLSVATQKVNFLTHKNDSLAKVVKVDTFNLTKAITRWKTIREEVLHTDTVPLTEKESVLVLKTDTVVMQCAKTINACLALNSTKDSLISQLNIRWDHRLKPPGFLKRTTHDLLLFGAGVGVGKVIR